MHQSAPGASLIDVPGQILSPSRLFAFPATTRGKVGPLISAEKRPPILPCYRINVKSPRVSKGSIEAAEPGFEPGLSDSESLVLPLHHSAIFGEYSNLYQPRRRVYRDVEAVEQHSIVDNFLYIRR